MELDKDNLGGYTWPTKLLDKDKVVIDSPNSSFTFKFVRSYLLQQRCFANINCNKGVSQILIATKVFRKAWEDLICNVQTFGPLLTQIKVYERGKDGSLLFAPT